MNFSLKAPCGFWHGIGYRDEIVDYLRFDFVNA
jgi:hypothetical protein